VGRAASRAWRAGYFMQRRVALCLRDRELRVAYWLMTCIARRAPAHRLAVPGLRQTAPGETSMTTSASDHGTLAESALRHQKAWHSGIAKAQIAALHGSGSGWRCVAAKASGISTNCAQTHLRALPIGALLCCYAASLLSPAAAAAACTLSPASTTRIISSRGT